MTTREPDPYEALQVRPNADHEVIQAAYEQLARRYRPDARDNPIAAERLARIEAAYAVVGDQKRRAEYDAALASAPATESAAPEPGPVADIPAVLESAPVTQVASEPAPAPVLATTLEETPISAAEPPSLEEGAWVQQIEAVFPVAWLAVLALVCLIGVYNAWDAIP